MYFLNFLSNEYITAIKWLKHQNLNIKTMDDFVKITFFNLWILSYFVLSYNDYVQLRKYTYSINSFKEFVKNIDTIIETNPMFMNDMMYVNLIRNGYTKEDYIFCWKLLKKTNFDNEYLWIVKTKLKNKLFFHNKCNLKNRINIYRLIKLIKNNLKK